MSKLKKMASLTFAVVGLTNIANAGIANDVNHFFADCRCALKNIHVEIGNYFDAISEILGERLIKPNEAEIEKVAKELKGKTGNFEVSGKFKSSWRIENGEIVDCEELVPMFKVENIKVKKIK